MGMVVLTLIIKGPGRTEIQLTEAIYGEHRPSTINSLLLNLRMAGLIERQGEGFQNDPYKYFPIDHSENARADISERLRVAKEKRADSRWRVRIKQKRKKRKDQK